MRERDHTGGREREGGGCYHGGVVSLVSLVREHWEERGQDPTLSQDRLGRQPRKVRPGYRERWANWTDTFSTFSHLPH